jgi:CheY-like chemotaxis protein
VKRGISILIVDDEALVREAMQRLLEHDGYEVEAFNNAASALAQLKTRKFDLVITDFSMPGMAGDEFVAQVRVLNPSQRIIMATAFVEEYRVFGQPTGSVDAVLLKPFAFKELIEAVELVLAHEEHDPATVMPPIVERSRSQDFLPPPKK